jgi:hypothetical protein
VFSLPENGKKSKRSKGHLLHFDLFEATVSRIGYGSGTGKGPDEALDDGLAQATLGTNFVGGARFERVGQAQDELSFGKTYYSDKAVI